MNLGKFPRRGYVTEPTPIEFLPNFTKALDAGINVYIKRDDLLPGTSGGNKTRKLDFCIADALNQGADTLITCGAVQSNHCRLTLAWAVHEGLDCHLVLEERVKDSYSPEASGNNFLFQLLGVKSITVVPGGSNMMGEMEKVAEKLRAEGRKPYIIPGGSFQPYRCSWLCELLLRKRCSSSSKWACPSTTWWFPAAAPEPMRASSPA